jgi:hypothetical protein
MSAPGNAEDSDAIRATALAFLDSDQADDIAHYLNRGRKHAGLEDGALQREWAAVYTAWTEALAASPGSVIERRCAGEMTDLACEIRFRGAEPAYGTVRASVALLEETVRNADVDFSKSALAIRVAEFLIRRDRWSN